MYAASYSTSPLFGVLMSACCVWRFPCLLSFRHRHFHNHAFLKFMFKLNHKTFNKDLILFVDCALETGPKAK